MRDDVTPSSDTLADEPSTGVRPEIVLAVPVFATRMVYVATLTLLPPLLVERGVPPSLLGLLVGVYGYAAVAMGLLAGALADRFRPARLAALGSGLVAVAIALLLATPIPAIMAAARLLHGVAMGLFRPTVSALVLQRVPAERRASAIAINNVSYVAGAATGPFVAGVVADRFGLVAGLAVGAVVALVAAGDLLALGGGRAPSVHPTPISNHYPQVGRRQKGLVGYLGRASMEEGRWAEVEFDEAELGDRRLTARLVDLASRLAEHPSQSLPEACADGAQLKAAYRFFDNEKVKPSAILKSHVRSTTARLEAEPVVLAVQDTTSVDYTDHPGTTRLGVLNDVKHQGFLVHTTLAITPERVPVGLLAQDVWTRDAASLGKRATRKQRPITEKESQKWLTSLEAVKAAHARCPETRFISVGDREADVFDLFLVERPAGVDLLVRAAWDRAVDAPQRHLWAAVAAAPEAGTLTVAVPRTSAQPGKLAQPARTAHLTLRVAPVTLRPPRHRSAEQLPSVPITAVWVVETTPPAGTRPIEWLLLTTCPVSTTEQAFTLVHYYVCRWGIEVWHKILKSGCQIEARQLETAERLERCLTLYSIIAWRVLYATLLARAAPDLPCTALLDPDEWQALACIIQRTPTPPTTPPSLPQAVRWIAQLGGFLARASDGEPGPITL